MVAVVVTVVVVFYYYKRKQRMEINNSFLILKRKKRKLSFTCRPRHAKTGLRAYADSEGPDQTARMRSLI